MDEGVVVYHRGNSVSKVVKPLNSIVHLVFSNQFVIIEVQSGEREERKDKPGCFGIGQGMDRLTSLRRSFWILLLTCY